MRFRSLTIALVLLAGVAHADEPNAADRESARVAFTDGNKLRDDGNVRGALEKYKAAYALAPTPITALEVGRAEMDLGQLVEAREVLLHVESIPEAHTESAKAQAARREASSLAGRLLQRIPKITIRVVGPVDQTSVSVDGVSIPREALAAPRAVNPGRHAVLALAFGHSAQQSVDLRDGESRDVVLDVTTFAPRGVVSVTMPQMQTSVPNGPSGLVAFNTPDDGHAWSLRDPSGHEACRLPCSQALGFATGWFVARDDGERVIIPSGLAALPGSSAQVTPSGSGGNPVLGWVLVGVGGAAAIASIIVLPATSSDSSGVGLAAFLVLLLGGATVATIGAYVVAFAHGPMLVRTDMGIPMRIARRGPVIRLTPAGVVGVF
jgi:hypothetical protein